MEVLIKYRITQSRNLLGGPTLYRVDTIGTGLYDKWDNGLAYYNTPEDAQKYIDYLKKNKIGEVQ